MGTLISALNNQKDLFYGTHEIELTSFDTPFDEVEDRCEKHKCHGDMIAVDKFSIENLPVKYRKEEIYNLAKAMAFLTVKLTVSYISENRPMLVPKTEMPYPLYDKKGSGDYISSGSGRICDVVRCTGSEENTCKCSKCKISLSPSKEWWNIKIFTATAVVFDSKEANQTSCTFYNEDDSKGENKIELSGCRNVWLDVEGDLCLVEISSCDKNFCQKLFSNILNFNKLWRKLNQDYSELNACEERLVIVVSCPHGLSKRISVGLGIDIGAVYRLGFSKYIYDAPTCKGSSGGPVYALGMDWFKTEYVHSGIRQQSEHKEGSFGDANTDSKPLDASNVIVHFKAAPDKATQSDSIFFTNSSMGAQPETLVGSEYIPQSLSNNDQLTKYKGYSTRWY